MIRGHLDGIIGRVAFGWALDEVEPSKKLLVVIKDKLSGCILGKGIASQPRDDLDSLGQKTNCYAFRIELSSYLNLGDIEAWADNVKLIASQTGLHNQDQNISKLSELHLTDYTALSQSNLALQRILELERKVDSISRRLGPSFLDLLPRVDAIDDKQSASSARYSSKNISVLIFSIIDWSFRFQRPQQISSVLASQSYDIYYVNASFSTGTHLSVSSDLLTPSLAPVTQNIWEITLKKPIQFSGDCNEQSCENIYMNLSDAMALWLAAQIRLVLDEEKLGNSVCVLMHPNWFKVCRMGLQELPVIYDCMDYIAGFPETSLQSLDEEKQLIKHCDALVTTSQFLYDKHSPHNRHLLIRNGCDYNYFSRTATLSQSRFAQYKNIGSPTVCYYGAISGWFDLDLVIHVASILHDATFLLAGSTVGCDVESVAIPKNIIFLGEVPYSDLTSLLDVSDVCIIPFKLSELIKATNPVKLYEYCAAGKPVVSTPVPEVLATGLDASLVKVASTPEDFASSIVDLAQTNTSKLVQARKSFASEHTWLERGKDYKNLLNIILPEISVIIPCHNNLHYTQSCIDSIRKYSLYPRLKVICVDDASSDGTSRYLEGLSAEDSRFSCILLKENKGFPYACNRGIEASGADYIAILNNDTFVTPYWLHKLMRQLCRDDSIGMCGPITNSIGNEQKISIEYSSMNEMLWRSAAFTLQRYRAIYEVERLAFFCVLMKREVIQKIGLLDEDFGLGYCEDDDYCMRARNAGYRLVVCDDVFIHHELSRTFGKNSEKRDQLIKANRARFRAKWGFDVVHSYRTQEGFG